MRLAAPGRADFEATLIDITEQKVGRRAEEHLAPELAHQRQPERVRFS